MGLLHWVAGGVGQDAGHSSGWGPTSPGTGAQNGLGTASQPWFWASNPKQASQNAIKAGIHKLSGGTIYPGVEPIPPNAEGLKADKWNIGGIIQTGGYDAKFADYTSMPGQVIGGTLTNDEKAMINLMDPKDRARYLLQKRVQEKAEMAVLLSQLQALRHQTAMSMINNIR
ncbi:MAG TPA: hypothetical protein VEY30_04915 [Myxococcaceae bacterium]|nr:hypothetical protein [Myxococcaceae bacterium]